MTFASRLMSLDERATVAALDAARNVFRANVESSQGGRQTRLAYPEMRPLT